MSIYLAGASSEATRCDQLRSTLQASGYHVYASWIEWSPTTHPDEEDNWATCLFEIRKSEALILLAPDPGHALRGAVFEAGYARGLNKPVYIFNSADADLGTWPHALGIHTALSFADLLNLSEWAK